MASMGEKVWSGMDVALYQELCAFTQKLWTPWSEKEAPKGPQSEKEAPKGPSRKRSVSGCSNVLALQ